MSKLTIILTATVDVVTVTGEDGVVSRAALQGIDVSPVVENRGSVWIGLVRPDPGRRNVAAIERVVAVAAADRVRPGAARDGVIAAEPADRVVAGCTG